MVAVGNECECSKRQVTLKAGRDGVRCVSSAAKCHVTVGSPAAAGAHCPRAAHAFTPARTKICRVHPPSLRQRVAFMPASSSRRRCYRRPPNSSCRKRNATIRMAPFADVHVQARWAFSSRNTRVPRCCIFRYAIHEIIIRGTARWSQRPGVAAPMSNAFTPVTLVANHATPKAIMFRQGGGHVCPEQRRCRSESVHRTNKKMPRRGTGIVQGRKRAKGAPRQPLAHAA